ncbi:MAG: nuclear transport factor 2 family protein [Flavobacterium sp.]|nr:nuclear transport factor 2 family protein [Flavobacterium sp.]
MKKIAILVMGLFALASCQENKRYTQQSPEIDTYKKSMEVYKNMDWENFAAPYADTAKICNNVTKEKAITVAQALEKNKEDATLFTWVVEKEEYEMVITDEGETWVNFWGLWKGTMKTTNKVYEIPFHNTARFIDGKIVEEHGYWDNSEIVTDMLNQTEKPEPEMMQATE